MLHGCISNSNSCQLVLPYHALLCHKQHEWACYKVTLSALGPCQVPILQEPQVDSDMRSAVMRLINLSRASATKGDLSEEWYDSLTLGHEFAIRKVPPPACNCIVVAITHSFYDNLMKHWLCTMLAAGSGTSSSATHAIGQLLI